MTEEQEIILEAYQILERARIIGSVYEVEIAAQLIRTRTYGYLKNADLINGNERHE